MHTAVLGAAPHRRFVIEWRNVAFSAYSLSGARLSVEIVLPEDSGEILVQYAGVNDAFQDPKAAAEQGKSATIGIENADGTGAFQYSFNKAVLNDGHAIVFRPST
jgi:hypothetical protein